MKILKMTKKSGIINCVFAIVIVCLFLMPNSSALSWTKGSSMGYTFQGVSGKFDSDAVESPSPIWNGARLYMLYMGKSSTGVWTIGEAYTFSPLKGTWTRNNFGDAVLGLGSSGKFDSSGVLYPSNILYNQADSYYYMWYTGYDGSHYAIGVARSSDLVTWSRDNPNGNAVLTRSGNGWESYNVMAASVYYNSGTSTYMMWYSGCSSSSTCDIGYASSSDGFTWNKYANNPVISHGGTYDYNSALRPWVLYYQSNYEMWFMGYTSSTGNALTLHTYASDGKSFGTPELFIDKGASGEYDSKHAIHGSPYTTISNEFRYLYVGCDDYNTYRIMYAFGYSIDTSAFYKFSINGPVVLDVADYGHFDTKEARDPTVIYDSGSSQYKMWYTGRISGDTLKRIGYAVSSSPDSGWTRAYPLVIGGSNYESLGPSASGWDSVAVSEPYVLKDGSTYKMYYVGNDGTNNAFGYATSSDGLSWTKSGSNPILQKSGSGWDSASIFSPTIVRVDSVTWKMWYVGEDSNGVYKIGYATSSDGISWTKYGSNPVMSPSANNIDADGVLAPSVFLYSGDGYYYMSYTCRQNTIKESLNVCEAVSQNGGTSWTKKVDGNGYVVSVINWGGAGTFDGYGIASSTILYQGGWKIWYSGVDRDYSGGDNTGWHWRIGYATGA